MSDSHRITPDTYGAVLFDLDGVLTKTAKLHAEAWAEMFDNYLRRRSEPPFVPFTDSDYDNYVDGKPRYDGVRDFLASRGITLPDGSPGDGSGEATVCGLGNAKQQLFDTLLTERGVETFPDAMTLLQSVRAAGVKTAVVSSSKNCLAVITAAGIADDFDVRVDGNEVEAGHLAGKPAPDTYLAAAERLGVPPARAVVVEDAQSGVAAGASGNFGMVVGVDRVGQRDALLAAGATVVVTDLATLAPDAPDPGATA